MTSNVPLRGGKTALYEGGIRVPLVVVWPGQVQPGTRSDALFSSVDFYPTILGMLGLPPGSGQFWDGVNQVPALLGQAAPRQTTFTFFPHYDREYDGPGAAVRQGDWKLIRRFFDRDDQSDCDELYNLRDDPGERRNLAGQQPDQVRALGVLLRQYLQETGAVLPVKNPYYDPKARPPAIASQVPASG
jgi:arylsulfatase A-like enzyme